MMFDVQARRGRWLRSGRRSFVARSAVAAVATITLATAAPAFAVQNYCIPHPTAEGCNILPRTGPHITAASISRGQLHLKLTFHIPGRFDAHLKRNPPPRPYDRDWGSQPTLGKTIPVGFHSAGPGSATIPLGKLAPGRYGVVIVPTRPAHAQPGHPLDRRTVPSWVYFTEQAGRAVDIRILQP